MAQYQPSDTKHQASSSASKAHVVHSGPSRLRNGDQANGLHLSSIDEPGKDDDSSAKGNRVKEDGLKTAKLRVDAFLGEWLSPDYYESITPPPNSVMMVAGAKADLLRRATLMPPLQDSARNTSHTGYFPGGWGKGLTGSAADSGSEDDGPLSKLSSLARVLPQRDRASSHGTTARPTKPNQEIYTKINTSTSSNQGVYVAPVPTYAISPSSTIPFGYVAHARDACVDVDHKWDSMRAPYDWGNGGEYGEEWSAMHKRFRKGLQMMMAQYREPESVGEGEDGLRGSLDRDDDTGMDEDDGVDTVLVLVTHGAGCNALIGALTNQPVLLDVGMASLTMAVRRDASNKIPSPPQEPPAELGISGEYQVRLVASTEHLRPATVVGSSPVHQSPRIPFQSSSVHRHRVGSSVSSLTTTPVDGGFSLPEPMTRAMTSVGLNGGLSRSASNASTSSTGLWSRPLPPEGEANMLGNSDTFVLEETAEDAEHETVAPMMHKSPGRMHEHHHSHHQRGLWGEAPRAIATERLPGTKRRWTVNEHH